MNHWWAEVRSRGLDYIAAGNVVPLPLQATRLTAFHSSCQQLYVRECFDGLYKEIMYILKKGTLRLCHLNGNSGVGKSAFLWYVIIRLGIELEAEVFIVFESGAFIWEFRGNQVQVTDKAFWRPSNVLEEAVGFHLIDQKVDPNRPIGDRALVAASPDETNIKEARKLRTTYTRYMPVWDKEEFAALAHCWRRHAVELPKEEDGSLSEEAKEIMQRLAAADMAFSYFGGIPRFIWDREVGTLTEEDFYSDIMKCIANTKLKNVRLVLQHSAAAQDVSWRLFHFKPRQSFRRFHYTFCSEKVASFYAQHLCSQNVEKLGNFLEASQHFPEYASLRGFVFEQYVISKALELMAMPMADCVYCVRCGNEDDRGKSAKLCWIQCESCRSWYHLQCTGRSNFGTGRHDCNGCKGTSTLQSVSSGGLLLRYYEGDLEDALLGAGKDAAKYLWRPLKKNNAVFDFVLLPRMLGQATVSLFHKPQVKALVNAQKALKAWRQAFGVEDGQDALLLFFVPPNIFCDFKFQRYMASRKVSQRAVKGVRQCKVAVPVNSAPYAALDIAPKDMPAVVLDSTDPDSWETTLQCEECTEEDMWLESPEISLEEEKQQFEKRGLVYDGGYLDGLDIRSLSRKQLQALCKLYQIRANTTNAEMMDALEAKREEIYEMDLDGGY